MDILSTVGSLTGRVLLFGLLGLSACVAPTSRLPSVSSADMRAEAHKQLVVALREQHAQWLRLARIVGPIFAANIADCGNNVKRKAGVYFTAVPVGAPSAAQRAAVEAYGLSRPGEVRVASTIPGFPAHGLLRPGETVTRINGTSAYGALFGSTRKNRYARTATVRVVRNGHQVDVSMPTVAVCSYPVTLVPDDSVNAAASRHGIFITTGAMRLMTVDRDVALIVGHEMAHLTRRHLQAQKINRAVGASIAAVVSGIVGVNVVDIGAEIGAGAFSQEFEAEADYVGMYYAARAGWDMSGGANLFRRLATAHPASIHMTGASHPSTAERAVLVERTALEIENKRRNNLALVPNVKGRAPPPTTAVARAPATAPSAAVAAVPAPPTTAAAHTPTAAPSTVAAAVPPPPRGAEAYFRRGVSLEQGASRPRDYARAVEWYRKAADLNHASALYNLGLMYAAGRGVRQNNSEANIYFRRAADQKHAKALFNLGVMSEYGRGVRKDQTEGLTWYILAAELGAGDVARQARDRLNRRLTPAQGAEARRRADQWLDDHDL